MQRKAIQLAKKTIVISLPSKWVKKNNIHKGDELELNEEEKQLIIRTNKEQKTEIKIINIEELGTYDPLYIAYLYQAGIDNIKINYQDRNVLKEIQKKIPELMGYEIIDQGEKHVEIKNVSNILEEEFDTILRRTFYLLEEMGKASLEAIETKNYERLKDILPLENSVDKFTDFCKRVLNKKGHKNNKKTQFYYVIIRDLEKIGDYYEDISKEIIETNITKNNSKKEIKKEILEFYKETNEFLQLFHKLFYKFEREKASQFQKIKNNLKNKSKELIHKGEKEDLLIIYNLASLVKTIGNLYGPYYSTII